MLPTTTQPSALKERMEANPKRTFCLPLAMGADGYALLVVVPPRQRGGMEAWFFIDPRTRSMGCKDPRVQRFMGPPSPSHRACQKVDVFTTDRIVRTVRERPAGPSSMPPDTTCCA